MNNTPSKTDIYSRTAILEKDGVFAAIGIYCSPLIDINAVANFDPRAHNNHVHRRSFETRSAAIAAYDENIAISRERGWTIIYNGARNSG